MNQNASDLPEGEIRDPVSIHSYSLRDEGNRTTNSHKTTEIKTKSSYH